MDRAFSCILVHAKSVAGRMAIIDSARGEFHLRSISTGDVARGASLERNFLAGSSSEWSHAFRDRHFFLVLAQRWQDGALSVAEGYLLQNRHQGIVSAMEIAKTIPAFYPDLIEQGGLANALRTALRQIGSSLSVAELDRSVSFVVYARIASGDRSSQIYIGATTRMFTFDFWNRGVWLANGATHDILELVRSVNHWVSSDCSTAELANAFRFVQVQSGAEVYERGEEVEMRWRDYLAAPDEQYPELTAFIHAAAAEPKLRQLFPFTSMNRFCFSRCTGYPFTRDAPHVVPLGGGVYEVRSSSGKPIGRGDAAHAVALTIAALPPNCGPAVPGTARQFEGDP